MRLCEWQAGFQQSVLQPHLVEATLFDSLSQGTVSKHRQFEVYSNAYVLRLAEALRSNYPAVHQLLGDAEFDALALAYIGQYPPTHASIRWFGEFLAAYFQIQSPYTELPVLAELARFEWALRHTIDAADTDVVTVESLQAIAPEHWGSLCFALHPSVSVTEFKWNTPQIWQVLSSELPPPEPKGLVMNWIVYRQPDLVSAWRSVSDTELAAFQCLVEGGRFSDICEVVAGLVHDDSGALQSAGLLRSWVEQGVISFSQKQ